MNQDIKESIRKYLNDDVDKEEIEYLFFDNSIDLHECVKLTNKYPKLNDFLQEYLKTNDNIDINEINQSGKTSLHYAALFSGTKSTERTVEILISYGANVNLQDYLGWSPLHYASCYSNEYSTEETINLLIIAGANVNLQTSFGWTPLHCVALKSRTICMDNTVELLIKAGANVNLQHDFFETPLHIACKCPNPSKKTIELLILAGTDMFSSTNGYKPVCDYFSEELLEYFQIDKVTKTVEIKIGRFTKGAKKK